MSRRARRYPSPCKNRYCVRVPSRGLARCARSFLHLMTNSHKAFAPCFVLSVKVGRSVPRVSLSKLRTYRVLREHGCTAQRAFRLVNLSAS